MKTLLMSIGFYDIKENLDGTIDATKDGFRYRKMHSSNISVPDFEKESSVVTIDVNVEHL